MGDTNHFFNQRDDSAYAPGQNASSLPELANIMLILTSSHISGVMSVLFAHIFKL
jgi:hypothetical protein